MLRCDMSLCDTGFFAITLCVTTRNVVLGAVKVTGFVFVDCVTTCLIGVPALAGMRECVRAHETGTRATDNTPTATQPRSFLLNITISFCNRIIPNRNRYPV